MEMKTPFSIWFLKPVVASDRWKEGLHSVWSLQYLFICFTAGIWRKQNPYLETTVATKWETIVCNFTQLLQAFN